MKISIITVTYNSENSIAHTIESVLGQNVRMTAKSRENGLTEQCSIEQAEAKENPDSVEQAEAKENPDSVEQAEAKENPQGEKSRTDNEKIEVEYLIIDGNSQDNTIKKVEGYRTALEEQGITLRIFSEPDKGIYDAMNKGIQLAEGDVIGILNSDDWYEPDALQTVADTFAQKKCDLMFANIRIYKRNGKTFVKKARLGKYETSRNWNHPTTFVKADLYKENLFKNLGIHDDYGFFLQMKRQNKKIVIVDKVLANFRMGGASNCKDLASAKKRIMDRYRYCYRINGYSRLYMIECVAIELVKMISG